MRTRNGGSVISDSADAPLIQRQDDHDAGDGAETRKLVEGWPGIFVWMLTLSAGVSGLLFGYDTGVISATLVSIDTSLSNRHLTSLDKSIITSSTSLFALLASPLTSLLADRYGRRRVILLADALFTVGALLQSAASTVSVMVAGRCIVGAGVGSASFVVPLYIAEIAPARYRGMLVTANVLFITAGQVVAYVVGWLFSEYGAPGTAWRWMVGLGAMPSIVQAVMVMLMPETPRWLVMSKRIDEARSVVERIFGGEAGVSRVADVVISEVEVEIREEEVARRMRGQGAAGWKELLTVRRNRLALMITCLLQGLQQLCGFNSLMYFSATIFKMVGFPIPTLTSLSVSGTNFALTVVAILTIDRVGRRRMLLATIPPMVAGLLLAAHGFTYVTIDVDPSSSSSDPANPDPSQRYGAIIILTSIILYVAFYALGLGNVPWMQSELFPLPVRSLGSGLATGTNWLANFVVGLTFLPLMDALGPARTFVVYALVCCVGYGLVWGWYPETAGLSLEETGLLLEGW